MTSDDRRVARMMDFMGDYVTNNVIDRLRDMNFFTAPASTRFHGNYEGGLFDHSFRVAKTLVELTDFNNLTWGENRKSVYCRNVSRLV